VAFFFKQSSAPQLGQGDLLDGRQWREFRRCSCARMRSTWHSQVRNGYAVDAGACCSQSAAPYQLTITRNCKPVIVVTKFDQLFSWVADAAQTIVDCDRMGIELAAIG
jgi:hypothetical protein